MQRALTFLRRTVQRRIQGKSSVPRHRKSPTQRVTAISKTASSKEGLRPCSHWLRHELRLPTPASACAASSLNASPDASIVRQKAPRQRGVNEATLRPLTCACFSPLLWMCQSLRLAVHHWALRHHRFNVARRIKCIRQRGTHCHVLRVKAWRVQCETGRRQRTQCQTREKRASQTLHQQK